MIKTAKILLQDQLRDNEFAMQIIKHRMIPLQISYAALERDTEVIKARLREIK